MQQYPPRHCVSVAPSCVGEGAGGDRRSLLSSPECSSATEAPPSVSRRLRRRIGIQVDAVAYYLPGKTALGVPVRKGVVAVDPKLIPLGTKLHVPGYGPGLAADVGTAIKGRIIDLWFPTTAKAAKLGPAHRHDHDLPVAVTPSSAASGTQFPMRAARAALVVLAVGAGASGSVGIDGSRGSARARRRARAGSSRAGRRPGPDGGDRGRPANGRDGVREERQPLAPPGFGREARRFAHGAPGSRAAFPVPHGGRRRRRTLGAASGTATSASSATATRRSRERTSTAWPGDSRRRGFGASRVASSGTTRISTRDATGSAGSARTSASSRHRCRRSRSRAFPSPARTARPLPLLARSRKLWSNEASPSADARARAEHRPSPSPSPSTSRNSCRGSSGGWTQTATTSSPRWC